MKAQQKTLLAAIDLLAEVRDLNEAAQMAAVAIADRNQRSAMDRLLGNIGAHIAEVDALLEAVNIEGESK